MKLYFSAVKFLYGTVDAVNFYRLNARKSEGRQLISLS